MMRNLLPAILLLLVSCSQKDSTLFTSISSSSSGINFNNVITESDSINPIDMEFLYNGGGVAIGDFNNDSLPDIYFTASQVPNRLYLNKGGMKFQDVTEVAKVTGEGRWSNAASVIDINNDGLLDIYVCASIKKRGPDRANLLYVNGGVNKDGVPVFYEMAKQYHLADTGYSVQAAFFDYDNDGDLDIYLVNTKLAQRNSTRFDGGTGENKTPLRDKLYRNDGATEGTKSIPIFTDVSDEAGINDDGYGLGIAIADLNGDGWKDIYVTNDFYTSDLLYLNQKNGTFRNVIGQSMKHTSQNAMGNDVADFNNDGLPDVVAVDMNPETNLRKKKNLNDNNYFLYQSMMQGELMVQYVRNTLQLNNGNFHDTSGNDVPVFSDISFLAGVAETDWSWSSLFADFDNDGNKDLFITNGYPKDVTDHDFAFFKSNYSGQVTKEKLLKEIPQIKIPNYAFRNTGTLHFENVTKAWGLAVPSFSCGAAYADLDNDGDLDYIINNINEPAMVYENHSEKSGSHYLDVKFKGWGQNINGLGATVTLYQSGHMQTLENNPYRGYLSSMDNKVHFGLGNNKAVDSMVVKWHGGRRETIQHPRVDRTIVVNIDDAAIVAPAPILAAYLQEVTSKLGIQYRHQEADHIDFDVQRLLPHKLSEYGPGLAAGDIDGNGLDDLFIGSAYGYDASYFLQQANGTFLQKELTPAGGRDVRKPEVMGILLFDADGDGDNDLYLASGSNESVEGSKDYQDRLFQNDGKGNFSFDSIALPRNVTSKSCVKAADIDNDGDLDLFVGGRLLPEKYPTPVSSYIFRNDSKDGNVRFTDITAQVAPELEKIGMICDGIWSDYDNDGRIDLILAGDWMPLTFFHNDNGKWKNVTPTTGLPASSGWWNSITAGDFDNDGDMDYVAGNLGLNSFYRADSLHPIRLYSHDFSKSGRTVIVPTLYLPDESGMRKEFPAHNRDDIMGQLPFLKKKFLTYKSFGEAGFDQLFDKEDIRQAFRVTTDDLASAYIENLGNGKFAKRALPQIAQISMLNGMLADDVNADGNLDLLICGNDYGTEVSSGRFDALNGLVLLGDGAGNFNVLPMEQSGFFVPGNAKALVKLKGLGNNYLYAATQNRSWLKIFQHTSATPMIALLPNDRNIFYTFKNGKTRKEEIYYGQSFLSQSSRFIRSIDGVSKIVVENGKGIRREIINSTELR